jgi:hypothetical protein
MTQAPQSDEQSGVPLAPVSIPQPGLYVEVSPSWYQWIPILAALAVSLLAARWQGLTCLPVPSLGDLFSRLSPLVFFALLIERFIEIVMSLWRSERANLLQANLQRLIASGLPKSDPVVVEAQNALIRFRADTLKWTMPIGFTFGLLLAATGVRSLTPFIDPQSLVGGSHPGGQIWWFNVSDTVFTGALLAGGADPIHKLLDLYRKLVEASAAKASGFN